MPSFVRDRLPLAIMENIRQLEKQAVNHLRTNLLHREFRKTDRIILREGYNNPMFGSSNELKFESWRFIGFTE